MYKTPKTLQTAREAAGVQDLVEQIMVEVVKASFGRVQRVKGFSYLFEVQKEQAILLCLI